MKPTYTSAMLSLSCDLTLLDVASVAFTNPILWPHGRVSADCFMNTVSSGIILLSHTFARCFWSRVSNISVNRTC